jgi:uncharacterized integral membrane protein
MPVQRNSTHHTADLPADALPGSGGPARPVPGNRAATSVRTRTGSVWVGVCVGALVLVALLVFMLQNTEPVDVSFLGMTGTAPLALVLLIAGLGVGIIALVVGSLRIGQLRRRVRAERRPAATPPPTL